MRPKDLPHLGGVERVFLRYTSKQLLVNKVLLFTFMMISILWLPIEAVCSCLTLIKTTCFQNYQTQGGAIIPLPKIN